MLVELDELHRVRITKYYNWEGHIFAKAEANGG